jgi:hypothetical protein
MLWKHLGGTKGRHERCRWHAATPQMWGGIGRNLGVCGTGHCVMQKPNRVFKLQGCTLSRFGAA